MENNDLIYDTVCRNCHDRECDNDNDNEEKMMKVFLSENIRNKSYNYCDRVSNYILYITDERVIAVVYDRDQNFDYLLPNTTLFDELCLKFSSRQCILLRWNPNNCDKIFSKDSSSSARIGMDKMGDRRKNRIIDKLGDRFLFKRKIMQNMIDSRIDMCINKSLAKLLKIFKIVATKKINVKNLIVYINYDMKNSTISKKYPKLFF